MALRHGEAGDPALSPASEQPSVLARNVDGAVGAPMSLSQLVPPSVLAKKALSGAADSEQQRKIVSSSGPKTHFQGQDVGVLVKPQASGDAWTSQSSRQKKLLQ